MDFVTRLQYAFFFAWLKKGKHRSIQATSYDTPNSSSHLGCVSRSGMETWRPSSVKSLPVHLGLVRFSLVQFSSACSRWISGPLPSSIKKLRVCVFSFSLTLSSTASHSCPSRQLTPGSRRHTGSSHWSRDCCGRRKHGWEPGKITRGN